MALTPDEVERRTFPIADWGYDRGEVHKFLVEVAATVRYAQHTVGASSGVVVDKARDARPIPRELGGLIADDGSADFTKVGEQVTKILEAAEALAAGLREECDREIIVMRADAETAAADRRREAEADAVLIRDQAKRVLVAAQDQASRIVAEAEDEATTIRNAAEQRLQVRTEKIERVAQQHADRVVRFEQDAVRRIEEARNDLQQAIERLTGSERNPVVDLSQPRPGLRTGSFEIADDGSVAGTFDPGATPVPPTAAPALEPVGSDPVSNLVRAAVERAVENSTAKRPGRPNKME